MPKEIDSVCPECMEIIKATLYPANGKVWIEKTCKEHGHFKDIFYGDIDLYFKCEKFWYGDGKGVEDPPVKNATICPTQCGLCNMHLSHSGLPIMDLTNRCNLTCPVCFANANTSGYLYEPSFDEVAKMLETLINQKPVKADRIQFSGGEPTVRPDFLDIVKKAKELGFYYIQVNTNGIKMADFEFAQAAKEAGVQNLYLQFDGLSDEIYKKTRSKSIFEYKIKAIENARRLQMDVILVPVIVRGLNDNQVGDIVRFAVKNSDVISGIAFQPVTFTGRYSQSHRLEKRYTMGDLGRDIERQTGYIDAMRDWFPIGCTSPLSKLASAINGDPVFTLSLHPHCSQGTYLYADDDGNVTPVSSFIDMENFLREVVELSRTLKPSRFELLSKLKVMNRLKKYYNEKNAPKGLTFDKFLASLDGFQDQNLRRIYVGKNGSGRYYNHFFVAGMHFMDAYNFSVERVMRCVIHYIDPKGRLYPFCAYNSAPVYRKRIEKKFMIPPDILKEKIISEGNPKELELIAKKMGVSS
ncbi:MAG: radical SAM protein [Nitrospirae bacterium]|nr:radical SAM protein [Nitrospirota bacterium]